MSERELRKRMAIDLYSSSGHFIINKNLIKVLGLVTAAYIGNLVDKYKYFEARGELKKGYFYLMEHQQTEQLNISLHTLRKSRKELVDLCVLKIVRKGVPARLWYCIDFDVLTDLVYTQDKLCVEETTSSASCEQLDVRPVNNSYKGEQSKGQQIKEKQTKRVIAPKDEIVTVTKKDRIDSLLEKDKVHPELFELFYDQYPRKTARAKAQSSWTTMCKKNPNQSWKEIMDALKIQAASLQWQDKQFIPMPTTWINQQRWEDDPSAYPKATNSKFKERTRSTDSDYNPTLSVYK